MEEEKQNSKVKAAKGVGGFGGGCRTGGGVVKLFED